MHFCVLAARLYGRVPVPRKTSLNWFMPALVNKSVGSSCGTTGEDGTKVWPCLCTKKSMNCWRISLAESTVILANTQWLLDQAAQEVLLLAPQDFQGRVQPMKPFKKPDCRL